jgi:hypothetical protein
MELDLFLPDLQLAFEYQGEHHYSNHYIFGSPVERKKRDKEKVEACKVAGIALVIIPHTWDEKLSTLISLICQQDSKYLSYFRD